MNSMSSYHLPIKKEPLGLLIPIGKPISSVISVITLTSVVAVVATITAVAVTAVASY